MIKRAEAASVSALFIRGGEVSDEEFVALVDLAEFLGRAAFVLLEDAVEVRDVVEAGREAYVGDGCPCADEFA